VAGGYTSEVKFVVEASAGREIAQWVREHLIADEHGGGPYGDEYRVTSVYFDTTAGDVFHRRESYGRSKYRIRRYQSERTVFLERKLRTAALLAKRRTQVDIETLGRLGGQALGNGDPARWFERRLQLRSLGPVCQVSYLRIARHARTPAGLARLTLDSGVAAVANPICGFVDGGETGLLDNEMILEIKFRSHVPVAFKQLVERFRLSPRPASKYRLAAKALGVVEVHA
jgi:hypothetical protein